MPEKIRNIIFISVIAIAFWMISFSWNEWFSETMPRHQLLQLPAMFALGIITGFAFSKNFTMGISWGIAVLLFIMTSFIFWMLPHSIDSAVIHPSFNRIMHINMFVAGLLLIPVLQKTIFEVRIIFLGMLSVMIIATGITLITYNILLCSAFTIEQQKETGSRMIIIGLVLFTGMLFIFFRGLGKNNLRSALL